MWVKLDDAFPDHPKIAGLSDAAFRAHVTALCYVGRHLTDGHLPDAIAKRIAPAKARRELEAAGLWTQNGTGLALHDYLDWNPSRQSVEERRAQKREAGRKGANARWHEA